MLPLLKSSNLLTVIVLLLVLPQSLSTAITQSPPSAGYDECSSVNSAFAHNEEVVYKIFYNWNFIWLSAGEVTFRVEETTNTYKLSATGRTYPSYEWFFKVRDYYEAIVDKQSLKPVKTIRDVHEGGYRLYETVEYHPDGRKVTSWRGRDKKKLSQKEFDLSGCTHDVLSAIYYTRNQSFEQYGKGSVMPLRIFLDREEYNLRVQYLGNGHEVNVKGHGKFRSIMLSPETVAGTVFSEGAVMKLYATDDNNRLPLLIDSPVSVGSIKAVLHSYKNLRHPLDSKLN